ncbi:MAG: bacteriochlorophyll 4-vinyl reductase [Butyricicoccus sp.]|jgi:hypothetical protein
MSTATTAENEVNYTLANVISTAIQIPGVKVNREAFLLDQFKKSPLELRNTIIEVGPIEAGCSQSELKRKSKKLVNDRTAFSSGASFLAGLPGGVAMTATIPGDVLQFYGVSLRMAQEIAYLYGEKDLWENDSLDIDGVTNQLILYCGVMLGASGASQTVRVLSSSLSKQIAKKLPQKALTKTFWFPIVKSISTAFGFRMTKQIFAKGVSKAVPIIGGVVSGGITLATMRPMGMRLVDVLEQAHFSYSQADFDADWQEIVAECENINNEAESVNDNEKQVEKEAKNTSKSVLEEIAQAKQLLDTGIISETEFSEIKAKLIAKL